MKVGELIDLRKVGMVWKSTVAAGKQPTTDLGLVGIKIGQVQSTGDTSRVIGGTALGGTKKTPMIRRVMPEAIGFRLGSKDHSDAYAKASGVKTEIRVSELIRRVKLSTLSKNDEEQIADALAGHKPTDVLKNRDIEQIAAIANVDLSELRDLAGFY
jgi:hypothetical protein